MVVNFCGFRFFTFLFLQMLPHNIPAFSNWLTQLVPLVAIPGPKNVAPTHGSHIANYDVIAFYLPGFACTFKALYSLNFRRTKLSWMAADPQKTRKFSPAKI